MINFNTMRIYNQTTNSLMFNSTRNNPYALLYFSENSDFISDYPFLKLRKLDFRTVIVPYTIVPKTKLTPAIIKDFNRFGLKSYSTTIKYPTDRNLIFDISNYEKMIDLTYKPDHYRMRSGQLLKNMVLDTFYNIPDHYNKIFLYVVNVDKTLPDIYSRKIYLFLQYLRDNDIVLPFNNMLMCLLHKNIPQYRMMVKNKEYKLPLILNYIKNTKTYSVDSEEKEQIEIASKIVVDKIKKTNLIKSDNLPKLKTLVNNYFSKNVNHADEIIQKNEKTEEPKKTEELLPDSEVEDAKRVVIASVLHRVTNNLKSSENIAKNVNNTKLDVAVKVVDNSYMDVLLPLEKPVNISKDDIIKELNIGDYQGNKYPGHLFQKRNLDFQINLQKDMSNAFRVLETKDIPIRLENIEVIGLKEKVGEIDKTDKSILKATLKDDFNNIHKVQIELPNIKEDGTFSVYGQRKCLINQIILCPISFPKKYMSKFESSYSTFYIWSRKLKTGNHLEIYIGNYKLPLFLIAAYSFGFENTLKLYNLTYDKKDSIKKTEWGFKTPNNEYIVFNNVDSMLKEELIKGIMKLDIHKIKSNNEFGTKNYFNDVVIALTGRVNSTYLINNALDNIVDPVAKQVLLNQQLPYKLDEIMYYMAERVVQGFVQDRNDISNQRIRNSEILVHLAQKQILAAYTTYREQVLSGNKEAKLDIIQDKVIRDFINLEVVASMEYSNPVEEMSVMTRLTPVGKSIGGIPSKRAIQIEAQNVHPSYFGNIDPLDTPEGGNIGIVQQLAIDAYISSSRGLINTKNINNDEKAGMLSTSTCLIPFIENNEGARIMMAANQSRQALPLKNPEPPMIQSGYETLLTNVLSEYFVKKSPCNGRITHIDKEYIEVTCSNGEKKYVDITPKLLRSGTGKHTLSIFKPLVKENQVVKFKEIIAEGSSMKNGTISLGRNLLVAMMPYEGYNYEDGIIISDRLVNDNLFNSLHLIEEEIIMKENDKLNYFFDKIGSYTKKGEPLLRKTAGEIGELIGFNDEEESEEFIGGQFIKKSPGGMIAEIEVFSNIDNIESKFPQLLKLANRTEKKYNKGKKEPFTLRGKKIEGVLIKYKIQQELQLGQGDKLTNRFASKGLCALIKPANLMPRTPWGEPIDILTNPIGLVNRMNVGQLYEMYCGLVSKELFYRISKTRNKDDVIDLLRSTMGKLDTSDNKIFSEDFIRKILKMSNTDYYNFIEQIIKNKYFPLIIPPFKAPNYKAIREVMNGLKLESGYNLYLPEYGTYTQYKVPVGYMYFYKLEHLGDLKIHARSTGTVTGKYMQPTQGKRSGGGQRTGELDSYSLTSYGALLTLQEMLGPMSDDHKSKNEMLADIIQTGETTYRKPQVSPTKDLLKAYFVSMMLTYE